MLEIVISVYRFSHLCIYLFFFGIELANLSNLEVLDLNSNYLNGSLPIKGKENPLLELKGLPVATFIVLAISYLLTPFPFVMLVDLITFGRLKVLDFSFNVLVGSIPQNIGKLSSLRAIYLTMNGLNGSFPFPGKSKT